MRISPSQEQGQSLAIAESEPIALAGGFGDEVVVVAVAEDVSACDVWFSGPQNWLGQTENVVVRVFGRRTGGRVLLGETALRDTQHNEDGSTTSAWVFSLRGAPHEGFEVTCQRGESAVALQNGRFTLRAAAIADAPTLVAKGGFSAPTSVVVKDPIEVRQSQASALLTTVSQSNASALQATVSQTTASALQATVSQSTASALQTTVSQSTASALQATVSQTAASALQTTATQGTPAAHTNRWPVILSDGTNQVGTTTNPLVAGHTRDSATTFAAATGSLSGAVVGSGTSVAVKSVAYLWHPSTNTKRVELRKVIVSYGGGAGTGHLLLRALRITGVSGTPGGTAITPVALEGTDSTSLTVLAGATGAPTRATTGDYFTLFCAATSADTYEWTLPSRGKPIVLRASVSEGIEVVADVRVALTTEVKVTVGFDWMEI